MLLYLYASDYLTEQLNILLSLTSIILFIVNKSIQWGLFHDAIANSRVYVQGTPTSNQL